MTDAQNEQFIRKALNALWQLTFDDEPDDRMVLTLAEMALDDLMKDIAALREALNQKETPDVWLNTTQTGPSLDANKAWIWLAVCL